MRRRVVISGIGLVTPLGTGRQVFGARLFAGECGVAPITGFATAHLASHLGAEVKDFKPRDFIAAATLRRMDRLSRMAVAGARLAVADAALRIDATNRDRMGIVLGSAFGATDVAAQFGRTIFTEGPGWANPILVPNTVINAPAGHVSIELGIRGINATVNHREASAETAIAYAAAEIQQGRAEVMLAGGADILSPFCFEVLSHFKALSPLDGAGEAARPFDRRHNGPVAGEGAGIVCLETLEHAQARGVTPYAEVAGWGLSAAPAPLSSWPAEPRGPVLAMRRALAAAAANPGAVDYVCAAANGHPALDGLEAAALETVFGSRKDGPLVSSLKGALGESFSSGGIRAAATVLAIQGGCIPPTLGLADPLPPLHFVMDGSRSAKLRLALVNGLAAGGTFASLALREVTGQDAVAAGSLAP
jgi:3-oxoacyl-[acyl-carrier-protein] synthase II